MPVCFLDIPYRQLSCLPLLSCCSTSHRSSSRATSALLSLSSPLPRVGALLLKFSWNQETPALPVLLLRRPEEGCGEAVLQFPAAAARSAASPEGPAWCPRLEPCTCWWRWVLTLSSTSCCCGGPRPSSQQRCCLLAALPGVACRAGCPAPRGSPGLRLSCTRGADPQRHIFVL